MKGTGIWNQELDHGDMLVIEKVFVSKEFHRQGLGRKMLESLLTLAQRKTSSFWAFVRPDMLKVDDVEQEWDSLRDNAGRDAMEYREYSRAVMFYRSLGYRRVGSTAWLALSPNNEHPSRQLAATEDFDPPEALMTSLHPLLTTFQQVWSKPEDRFEALRNCMQQQGSTDACWTTTDRTGNTVLHLAAS